jgi:hypothetical protein
VLRASPDFLGPELETSQPDIVKNRDSLPAYVLVQKERLLLFKAKKEGFIPE